MSKEPEALEALSNNEQHIRTLEEELVKAKARRLELAKRAHSLGVSKYRIAQVTGRHETTVGDWLK